MSENSDAKLGGMYRRLQKAKAQLKKRRNDANQMAKYLRILADCFDEEHDAQITNIRDGRFDSNHTDAQYHRVGGPWPDFPIQASKIAEDILNLEREIRELEKGLALEIGCL